MKTRRGNSTIVQNDNQQQQPDLTELQYFIRHLPFFPVHEKNQNSSASNWPSSIDENIRELRSTLPLLYDRGRLIPDRKQNKHMKLIHIKFKSRCQNKQETKGTVRVNVHVSYPRGNSGKKTTQFLFDIRPKISFLNCTK